MATLWRKTMLYLGLGPDSEYDDYDPGYDDASPAPGPSRSSAVLSAPSDLEQQSAVSAVRPMNPTPRPPDPGPADFASQVSASGGGMGAPMGGIGAVTPASGLGGARPRPKVVRPLPVDAAARPRVVVPSSFNQAQALADTFKGGQPVVMNLRQAERDVARRLIDFSSGLCYGLGGKMDKVANHLYLLTPSGVEVAAEELRRLAERSYES
jgi:cell division inhibitor SepF